MDGWRTMRINSQERAMSTDINRLQAFQHQDVSEIFRYLLDLSPQDVDVSPGIISEPSTIETPLRAEIVNGFMVKPQPGALNLLVDAGAMFVMAPDAAPDESNYKLFRDAGVTIVGALAMTGNASGSVRIDVIECQINPVPEIATESRDVFDTILGGFTAATVTKEIRGRMTYRVRAGTPGAGMPANQSGWLPLCVASVPNGATSCDQMTFWDVRPVMSDRAEGIMAANRQWPLVQRSHLVVDDRTNVSELRMSGQVVAALDGRRIGGMLKHGVPGTEVNYVNLSATANWAGGFSFPAANGIFYVYLLTPFGLPRWARYTDGPAGRVPRAPYGIICLANVAPQHLTGRASAAISLPSSTGLGGTTSSALCIAALKSSGAGGYGMISDGSVHWLRDPIPVAAAASTLGSASYNLVEGTTHPANAKAVYVRFYSEFNFKVDTVCYNAPLVRVKGPGGLDFDALISLDSNWYVNTHSSATTLNMFTFTGVVRIPIWSQYPATAGGTKQIEHVYQPTRVQGLLDPTFNAANLEIYGWELGP